MACLEERGILCDHTRLEVHATILSRPSLVLMPMMGQIDLIIHVSSDVNVYQHYIDDIGCVASAFYQQSRVF